MHYSHSDDDSNGSSALSFSSDDCDSNDDYSSSLSGYQYDSSSNCYYSNSSSCGDSISSNKICFNTIRLAPVIIDTNGLSDTPEISVDDYVLASKTSNFNIFDYQCPILSPASSTDSFFKQQLFPLTSTSHCLKPPDSLSSMCQDSCDDLFISNNCKTIEKFTDKDILLLLAPMNISMGNSYSTVFSFCNDNAININLSRFSRNNIKNHTSNLYNHTTTYFTPTVVYDISALYDLTIQLKFKFCQKFVFLLLLFYFLFFNAPYWFFVFS